MFTGLVEEVGLIKKKKVIPDGLSITVEAHKILHDLKINDSVSCSGICLTVVEIDKGMFSVQLVHETLKLTNAKYWDEETTVNLERSLLPTTRIGGHFVQGHVDSTAKIKKMMSYEDSAVWHITIPKNLHHYIVHKGSICLDGISLTVAEKTETYFSVALIPHTLNVTTWHDKKVGDIVNVEVDIMAKYIKSLLGDSREA